MILCTLDWLEKEYFKSLIKNQIWEVCRLANGTRLEKSVWRMYLIWVVQYICSCDLLATKWVLTFGRDTPLTNWKQKILFLFSSAFEISFEINNERAFLHSVSNESEQREGLGMRIALIKYSCSVCRWCHYPALYIQFQLSLSGIIYVFRTITIICTDIEISSFGTLSCHKLWL